LGHFLLPAWFYNVDERQHTFDADGRPTDQGRRYDAEGRQIAFDKDDNTYAESRWVEITYDGGGNKIKTNDVSRFCYAPDPCRDYYKKIYRINSSVIGETLLEVEYEKSQFSPYPVYQYRRTSIFANGEEIAERNRGFIGTSYENEQWYFKSTDPSGVEHNAAGQNGGPSSTTDPFGAGVGSENPYPPPETAPDPQSPAGCDFGFDGEQDGCTYPEEYEDTDSEETGAGSVSQNTCYIDGVEQQNCDEVQHFMDIHDDAPVTKSPDFAPSTEGPLGIHQNEDPTDNDGHNGNAGEKMFEQQYTLSEVFVTVSDIDPDSIIGTASDWDLRSTTTPEPRPEATPPPNPEVNGADTCTLEVNISSIASSSSSSTSGSGSGSSGGGGGGAGLLNHLYITLTDSASGVTAGVRAGPSEATATGSGYLLGQYARYSQGFVDYESDRSTAIREVYDGTCDSLANKFQEYIRKLNNQRVPYQNRTTNSNAFVSSILNYSGINTASMTERLNKGLGWGYAPGWEHPLPVN